MAIEKPGTEARLSAPNDHAGLTTPSNFSMIDEIEKERGQAVRNDDEDDDHDSGNGNEIQDRDQLERVESSQYPTSFKLLWILVAIMLSIFLVALDMTIVATAIPRITDDFKSLDNVGWYGSAFFLTVASFQSTWGKAYRYFRLKIAFLLAIGIFEVGSLICAVSKNSTTLIVGRAIAGAGGAGIASGAYTIIAFSVPAKQTAAFTGILGAVYAAASVVGPLLGGVFTDNLSWRWCFYINLPIGGASTAIIFFFFQTPKAAKVQEASLREKFLQMDFPGTFMLMASFVCLILALQWGGVSKPWGSADVVGTLVGFVLILIIFVAFEIWQDDRALIVPRLVKQKTIALLSGIQAFNSGVFLMFMYFLPIYFQVVAGVSASQSGIRNLPYILGIALLTIVSGVCITVTGQYIPLLVVGSVLGCVGSGLIYTLDIGTPSSHWIGYQALAGIGFGLVIQIPIIVAQAIVEPADISSITAIMIFFQTISGAIFVSTGQTLFTNKLVRAVPLFAPGVDPALVVATGATELRRVFPASQLPGIIKSFMAGLKDAYIMGVALAGMSVIVTILMVVIDRRKLNQKPSIGGAA